MAIYRITGNTYQIKEDLKACRCKWDNDNKSWLTPFIEKDDVLFLRLESITKACGANMFPVKLNGDAEKIQKILNNQNLK